MVKPHWPFSSLSHPQHTHGARRHSALGTRFKAQSFSKFKQQQMLFEVTEQHPGLGSDGLRCGEHQRAPEQQQHAVLAQSSSLGALGIFGREEVGSASWWR